MKWYDDTKLLYLETDASGIGLGAACYRHKKGQHAKNTWYPATQFCIP